VDPPHTVDNGANTYPSSWSWQACSRRRASTACGCSTDSR
jgi:hypothetical protein